MVLSLIACNKQEDSGTQAATGPASNSLGWSKGDCIDRPLSPYVYQIADFEEGSVFLYKMGEMGKKITKKSISELKEGKEPFKKVPCP